MALKFGLSRASVRYSITLANGIILRQTWSRRAVLLDNAIRGEMLSSAFRPYHTRPPPPAPPRSTPPLSAPPRTPPIPTPHSPPRPTPLHLHCPLSPILIFPPLVRICHLLLTASAPYSGRMLVVGASVT